MVSDFAKLVEKIAEATRQGVQVERMWQQKLEEDQKKKQIAKPS
jgi:hypothetical protein